MFKRLVRYSEVNPMIVASLLRHKATTERLVGSVLKKIHDHNAVMAALKKFPNCLKYVGSKVKLSAEAQLVVVKANPLLIKFLVAPLAKTKEVALNVRKKNRSEKVKDEPSQDQSELDDEVVDKKEPEGKEIVIEEEAPKKKKRKVKPAKEEDSDEQQPNVKTEETEPAASEEKEIEIPDGETGDAEEPTEVETSKPRRNERVIDVEDEEDDSPTSTEEDEEDDSPTSTEEDEEDDSPTSTEDDEEDEDDVPVVAKPKKEKKVVIEDDEDDVPVVVKPKKEKKVVNDEEDEDDVPVVIKPKKEKKVVIEDDEDDDTPPVVKPKKEKKKPVKQVDPDEEDETDDDILNLNLEDDDDLHDDNYEGQIDIHQDDDSLSSDEEEVLKKNKPKFLDPNEEKEYVNLVKLGAKRLFGSEDFINTHTDGEVSKDEIVRSILKRDVLGKFIKNAELVNKFRNLSVEQKRDIQLPNKPPIRQ
jgi:hypothetical protein